MNTVYLPRRIESSEIYLSENPIDGQKMDCPEMSRSCPIVLG